MDKIYKDPKTGIEYRINDTLITEEHYQILINTGWAYKYSLCFDEDIPTMVYPDGTKKWFYDGKLHRTTGPAVEDRDGKNFFYLNGSPCSFKDWLNRVDLSDDEKIVCKLRFGMVNDC